MNNPEHFSESLETIFWIKIDTVEVPNRQIINFLDGSLGRVPACDAGTYLNSLTRIQDPIWKKFGSGIRYKHPRSATLHFALSRERGKRKKIRWSGVQKFPNGALEEQLFFSVTFLNDRILAQKLDTLQPKAYRYCTFMENNFFRRLMGLAVVFCFALSTYLIA